MTDASLAPGLVGEAARTVTEDLTATRLGSGDVPVFGTPALLALLEEAAVACVRDALPAGRTSVGAHVDLEHLAPSWVGDTVRAVARLEDVDGKRLRFACEAFGEDDTLIGRARHTRVVVDRARFER